KADSALLGLAGCADQAEDPVRLVSIAGPDFLAIDQPVIAFVFRLCVKARQVRSGTRFGIALAPANLAACDLRKVMLFLLLAPELEHCGPKHGNSEAGERRTCADPLHFLLEDAGFGRRKAAPAIIHRP